MTSAWVASNEAVAAWFLRQLGLFRLLVGEGCLWLFVLGIHGWLVVVIVFSARRLNGWLARQLAKWLRSRRAKR